MAEAGKTDLNKKIGENQSYSEKKSFCGYESVEDFTKACKLFANWGYVSILPCVNVFILEWIQSSRGCYEKFQRLACRKRLELL